MADIILTQKDIARFFAKTKRNEATGCLEWQAGRRCAGGYGAFRVGGRKGWYFLAHRVAWTIAHGPIPEGMLVLHHCDNPPCVEVESGHLFLGTHAMNNADKMAKGRGNYSSVDVFRDHPERRARGERQGLARLTAPKVKEIRALALGGASRRSIAGLFGVNETTIANVVLRRTWRHVD